MPKFSIKKSLLSCCVIVPSKSVKKMNFGLVLRAGVGGWSTVAIFDILKSGSKLLTAVVINKYEYEREIL